VRKRRSVSEEMQVVSICGITVHQQEEQGSPKDTIE